MRHELEKDIQDAILTLLRLKGFVAFKHHSTGFTVREGKSVPFRYGDKGIADIIACAPDGRFWAVEVKRKGGKISDDQHAFLRSVTAAGGVGIVAFSVDDVISVLGSEVHRQAAHEIPKPPSSHS